MAHVVEVDQSGKFGDTQQDTILAFANGITWSIRIPKAEKRLCLAVLKEQGIPESPALTAQLFATTLFFLLHQHVSQLYRVVIDTEYTGKEPQIKEHLLNLFHRAGQRIDAQQIHFWQIGKNSPAHEAAIQTLRRKRTPDRIITATEILGEFRTKKIGDPKRQGKS